MVLFRVAIFMLDQTLIILERVTMVADAAGVDATTARIAPHVASGSKAGFDDVHRREIDGDSAGLHAVGAESKGVARPGEPFVTGRSPAEAAAFTRRHGLTVIDKLGPAELTRRHLIGSDGKPDGRLPHAHGLIDARVP